MVVSDFLLFGEMIALSDIQINLCFALWTSFRRHVDLLGSTKDPIHDSDPPNLRKARSLAQRHETDAEHSKERSSSFSQFYRSTRQIEIRSGHDLAKLFKLSDVGVDLRAQIKATEPNY